MPGIMSEGSVQAFVAKPMSNHCDFDSEEGASPWCGE